ncbi:MAG: MFS transporter [Anaerolineae bacterium]|nr:MFS transporter [Anaerolineae bacterium]
MQFSAAIRRFVTKISGFRPGHLSLENRNIFYFTADTVVQGVMMGGVFSFISVFLVRLGATKLQTSLLTSLPAIVMVLVSIPCGQIVQNQVNLVKYTNFIRIFHRGSVLLVALLPFFTQRGLIEIILVIWSVKAIANSLLESSWMAVVAEVIPPRRRAKVNGTRWALVSVVTAVSVAIFGYILDRLPFPLSYQIVFFISFIGGSVGMLFWSQLRIPDNKPPASQTGKSNRVKTRLRAFWTSIQEPAFLRFELTVMVLRIAINLPTALYTIYWIRHLNATDLWIGWQTTTGKLALIAGYFFWPRIVERKGHQLPLLICTVGMGLYPVLTGFVPNQMWLPLVSIFQGFFMPGINLAFFDTLLSVCPPDRRPTFIAVNTTFSSFIIFAAPLLGSFLADIIDLRSVFFVTGCIHILAVLFFWKYKTAPETNA